MSISKITGESIAVGVSLSGNTVLDNLTVTGDFAVSGNTITLNVETLTIEDKNIVLANTASPTDILADGAGITVKGATDKTFNWVDSTDSWTSSENLNLVSGKTFKIAGTDVLSGNTLGSGITSSSLTSVGTLSSLNVTGNVGIGTSSPGARLAVKAPNGFQAWIDSFSTTGTRLIGINSAGTDYAPIYIAGSPIGFAIGASQAMLLDSSGNLGLGVTPSAAYLTVSGSLQMGQISVLSQDINSFYINGNLSAPTGKFLKTGNFGLSFHVDSAAGSFKWFNTAAVGTAGAFASTNQAMTLTAAGDLGIGTASPDAKLEVAVGDNGAINIEQTGANQTGYLNWRDVDGTLSGRVSYDHGTDAMRFATTNTERARITSAGDLQLYNNIRIGNISYAKNSQKTFAMDMGTYYAAPSYLNYAVRIGRLITGATSKLMARIVRHGDYNYNQYMIHEITATKWVASEGIINFAGKEMLGLNSGARWATDSSGYLYYLDDMLWEQNGYLMVYADENFEFTLDYYTQASVSTLTWRTITTTIQGWEVNYGT
jgi:hypothetical protein